MLLKTLLLSVFFLGATIGFSVRTGRIFPFWTWGVGFVRFENGLCGGRNSLMGTCYSRRQCNLIDGVGTAACASGIGVCCVVQRTCGDTTNQNNTYFVSPGFPNSNVTSTSCTLNIQRCNSDICQVRIDFLTLTLAQPNINGTCVNDALYVIGGASIIPVICGENSGQHIYVDFNGNTDIQLVINTNGVASLSRAWNIKVSQIGCGCPTRAPTGCLMYYTALSGTVRSFNYGSTANGFGTRQLANENYGICVEMQPGYCSIRWSATAGDMYSFTVSNDTNSIVPPVGTDADTIRGSNCTMDFVVIPNPIYPNGTAANTDRFCGNGFNTVMTGSKPFVMTVVTNSNEVNETGNRGFSMMYTQQRCTGTATGPVLG